MDDNPVESSTNTFINIISAPIRFVFWILGKTFGRFFKGVGESND